MFSFVSPLVKPLKSWCPGRVTRKRREYDFTMWLLLGSNSLLDTAREGKLLIFEWLRSGFRGTCFLPVGTCLMGQLTSYMTDKNTLYTVQNLLHTYRALAGVVTLRFLWHTFTSRTSRVTEFCSFSEFGAGLSEEETSHQWHTRKHVEYPH